MDKGIKFAIERFPGDLARRINVHIAASGETRRDFIVRLVEKELRELEKAKK